MNRFPRLLVIATLVGACQEPIQPASLRLEKANAAIVRVAAPTGNPAIDIPNIRGAIAAATPGAVIQFAHGTYDIGDPRETQFVVSTVGVTLQGDRRGTTLRGVELDADNPDDWLCCALLSGTFLLNGGHQTVRGLTFDGYVWAISIGAPGTQTGGYRVEKSTFRDGFVGVDFAGLSEDATTIEGNTFENVTAPVFILGKTLRIRHNLITITDPSQLTFGQPAQAVLLAPEILSGGTVSENNVIEENTIVRYNEGVFPLTSPGDVVRNTVIRNNEIIDARIYNAIFIDNGSMVYLGAPGLFQNNVIQDNVLRGSEGVGLVLDAGSGNQIIGNAFHDLPGLKSTFSGFPGTAIVLGATTSQNRVRGNEFENVVNTVVDLGTDNSVKGARQNPAALSAQRIAAPEHPANGENPRLRLFRGMLKH
jgi:parallel beta helix pectate lyase-like protein